MDLTYSPEHQAFRREVLVFLEAHRHAAPKGGGAAQRPSAEAVAWQKLLIAHGYAARTIPKEFGGYGAAPDILKSRIISEEFARASVGCVPMSGVRAGTRLGPRRQAGPVMLQARPAC